MKVPVLRQGPYLIATIQSALSDADLLELRNSLGEETRRARARGVVLDVTSMDVLDSFATRTLQEMGQMIRLLGARTVIVGLQPEVALAMVQLGLHLDGLATALDLEEGLAWLRSQETREVRQGCRQR